MKTVCVIDGQGGGIGCLIIKKMREKFGESVDITALGTNALATSQMLKAGANKGASGENAIVRNVATADIVTGTVGISWAHALMGEVTPKMAEAVTASGALKLFIPLYQENIKIVGVDAIPLPHLVNSMIEQELVKLV